MILRNAIRICFYATIFCSNVALGADNLNTLPIGNEPQLFLDDYCIERMEGLQRHIQHPQRLPEPVLDRNRFGTTQPYMSVVYDKEMNQYRLWYNRGSSVWHVNSEDGVRWENERPVWQLARAYGCSLIDDRIRCADPARRFKMANWQSTINKEQTPEDDSGMYVGFSPDGLTWQKIDGPTMPMWPGGYDGTGKHKYESVADIIDVFYDPIRRHYAAAVKQWSVPEDGYDAPRRLVAMTTSTDFLHWKPIWRIFTAGDKDEGQTEFYGMGGIHARGSLLIGFVRVLRDDLAAEPGGPVRGIGYSTLATSRDGKTWHRHHEPFLDRNPKAGTWDRAMTWIGAQLPVNDELYLYYGGYALGHKGNRRQIGLAKMRKDRYMALSASAAEGYLLTPMLTFSGNQLTLNVNAGKAGAVRVEIQDAKGKPIDGLSLSECDPTGKDEIAHTVRWRGRSDVSALAGKSVRLKFSLNNADLYAFQFKQENSK